jgi:hypothetical protein
LGRFNNSTRFRLKERLSYRKLADGGILYDGKSRQVHHLNATAAFVWEECQKGKVFSAIVESMCSMFEVKTKLARDDLKTILRDFAEADLFEDE